MWIQLASLAGIALTLFVLLDAFETVLLPRTVSRRFRLTRWFYRVAWLPWRAVGRRMAPGSNRENLLSFFGALSLLVLFGLWAAGLIAGFGLMQWALAPVPHDWRSFLTGCYLSGTTFFTLGLGDVKPENAATRLAAVAEAGIGFGFLATIIGYLPVIYAGFSRREVTILRLDVRAGSPPTAGELIRQHGHRGENRDLDLLLRDFELWSAELLESHLSYPVLCMYRSQHRDQSWLATLTAILDTCALLIVGVEGIPSPQAPLTFAMARRAMIDLHHLFSRGWPQGTESADRLPPGQLIRLRMIVAHGHGARLQTGPEAEEKLRRLRATYEPAAHWLSEFLLMPLPPWMPPPEQEDRPASAAEQFFEEEGATDVSIV